MSLLINNFLLLLLQIERFILIPQIIKKDCFLNLKMLRKQPLYHTNTMYQYLHILYHI